MSEIMARGATVLVISFAPVEGLSGYRAQLALPFTLVSDPERRTYRAYGLGRGSRFDVWHPRTIWRYIQLLRRGMKLSRPAKEEDLSQLGGDFVIDRDGRLAFVYLSRRPDDRPSVTALLEQLR